MPYSKRSDIPTADGWTALQLDDGALVAVRISLERCMVTQNRVYVAEAAAIDSAGSPLSDSHGLIASIHRHSCSDELVDKHGADAMLREHALLVLGEPPTLVDGLPIVPWSDEVRSQSSIRRAIAAADSIGPVNLASVM